MPNKSIGNAAALMSEIAQITKQVLVPQLQEALREIPEDQAFALEMSFHEGESDESIASMMLVSVSEVQDLKRQAKDSLMQTQFGQELETQERLETVLELTGRYWLNRNEKDKERCRQALEEAYTEICE